MNFTTRKEFQLSFWPVSVDDGVESETVPPWLGEVLDLDAGVLVGGLLGPSQQRLLGTEVLLANNNVRDLKIKRISFYSVEATNIRVASRRTAQIILVLYCVMAVFQCKLLSHFEKFLVEGCSQACDSPCHDLWRQNNMILVTWHVTVLTRPWAWDMGMGRLVIVIEIIVGTINAYLAS